jgi:hypothetical protein
MNNNTKIVLVFLVFILCICSKKLYESFCPSLNSEKDKIINEIQETNTNSQQSARTTLIRDKENKKKLLVKERESKSFSDLINWLLDANNIFTWDNVNISGNKVVIKALKKNQPFKISNIQIWGKDSNNITRNWAESHPDYGDVSVKLSSLKSRDSPPIYINNIKQINGEFNVKKSVVECPDEHSLISCSCYSPQGTCNGSEIKNNNCIAISRDGGFNVQARAMCAKTSIPLVTSQKESKPTIDADYAKIECDDEQSMISCNCIDKDNKVQACKGSNIEKNSDDTKFECRAYRNISTYNKDAIKAVATCAILPGASVRSTLQNKDEFPSKNGIATSKCKYNEKMIGCNCYAVHSKKNNKTVPEGICKGATFENQQCQVESIAPNNTRVSVFADATCARFDTDGEKCINNQLYSKINENGEYLDNSCTTNSSEDDREYIIVKLPKKIFIDKIILYKGDYTSKKLNKSTYSLYPIEVNIQNDSNIMSTGKQISASKPIQVNSYLPNIPQGVDPGFYDTVDIGLANYYKGWHNIHSLENKSYCRFLSVENPESDDNNKNELNPEKKDVLLSCVNPNTSNLNLKSEITSSVGESFNPGIIKEKNTPQYMADETGDGYEDFCRCVPNKDNTVSTLQCIKSDPKKHFYEEFQPPDKFLEKDCQEYTGEELKNIGKQPKYKDCSPNLEVPNLYSINASFYNKKNQRYYMFKNVRFDHTKFVLFCEIDKNHNIIEGYPQFVSREFWGDLPSIFLTSIDETIYGTNDIVYFISGDQYCKIDLNSQPKFKVISDGPLNELIPTLPERYFSGIQTGYFQGLSDPKSVQKIILIKRSQFVEITIQNIQEDGESEGNTNSGLLVSTPDEKDRLLQSRISINPEFQDFIDLKHSNIKTMFSIYDTKGYEDNEWIYIFTDTDVYKYSMSKQKFSTSNQFNMSKKINELYPTLSWDIPNTMNILKPSPII